MQDLTKSAAASQEDKGKDMLVTALVNPKHI